MRICLFGPETDHQTIMNTIASLPRYCDWVRTCHPYSDYDSFVEHLRNRPCDAIFVTEDNANGMEGVIAARNVRPDVPIIWFSNDEGFGCQAYRLNTEFFHAKPVTAQVLEMALNRLPDKRRYGY